MKKSCIFFILILTIISVNAQINLTSANNTPSIGSTYTYYRTGATGINVSHSGSNQTWDFSVMSGPTQYYSFDNLSNSSYPLLFPSANLVGNRVGYEEYYLSTATSYSIVGKAETVMTKDFYPDNIDVLKFPITYLDNFTGTFSGTRSSSSNTYNRSGTSTMTADGYGALILPYTTVNNVLKVTNVYNFTDSLGSSLIFTSTDTLITFYNSSTNNYIASYWSRNSNGSTISRVAECIVQSDLIVGINEVIKNENEVIIYPNPTNKTLILKSDKKLSKIEIFDMTGTLVKKGSSSFNLNQVINIEDLNPGVYFIKYIDDLEIKSQKIIIE